MSALQRTVKRLPERNLWRDELPQAKLHAFVPFRWFYGGYLVYGLNGGTFRQYLGNKQARELGLRFTPAI